MLTTPYHRTVGPYAVAGMIDRASSSLRACSQLHRRVDDDVVRRRDDRVTAMALAATSATPAVT